MIGLSLATHEMSCFLLGGEVGKEMKELELKHQAFYNITKLITDQYFKNVMKIGLFKQMKELISASKDSSYPVIALHDKLIETLKKYDNERETYNALFWTEANGMFSPGLLRSRFIRFANVSYIGNTFPVSPNLIEGKQEKLKFILHRSPRNNQTTKLRELFDEEELKKLIHHDGDDFQAWAQTIGERIIAKKHDFSLIAVAIFGRFHYESEAEQKQCIASIGLEHVEMNVLYGPFGFNWYYKVYIAVGN